MLPKNGHSVEKKYFLYSIIKIYNVNYYLKHRKNIFCNLTIFELVNAIEDFESLCLGGWGQNMVNIVDDSLPDSHFRPGPHGQKLDQIGLG